MPVEQALEDRLKVVPAQVRSIVAVHRARRGVPLSPSHIGYSPEPPEVFIPGRAAEQGTRTGQFTRTGRAWQKPRPQQA
ncbi:hypothetical protein ACFPN7_15075 [Amycolatopsis halotolerans]|uniref:hypothetical protein n=1 Tax=Amycolatopsis halotolerans TaxID=330083 RepID=UPI003622AB4C